MATIETSSTTPWRRLLATTIVAVSLCVAWGLLCGWGFSIVEQWTQSNRIYESINVTREGTPVIVSRFGSNWQNTNHFSLDRQSIEVDDNNLLTAATFDAKQQPRGLFEPPLNWRTRVSGTSNYSKPFATWYFIRSRQRPSRGYFEIYDPSTKLLVAYASRAGVMPTKPPADAWFDIEQAALGYGTSGALTGSFYSSGEYIAHHQLASFAPDIVLPNWIFYLQDGNQILQIDMRKQQIKPLLTVDGARGIAEVFQPNPKVIVSEDEPKQDATEPDAASESESPEVTPTLFQSQFIMLAAPESTPQIPITGRLVVRSDTEILLIHPGTKEVLRFKLPKPYRTGGLIVYSIGEQPTPGNQEKVDPTPQLLISHAYRTNNGIADLAWIDETGKILREEDILLAGYDFQEDPRTIAWAMTGIVPVAAMWLIGWTLGAPLNLIQDNVRPNYSEAFAYATDIAWQPLLVVLLLATILAVIVWRWHRQQYRPHAGLWAAFVFLLGPAGLAAYALHWRRPPVDTCQACGKQVPRDRPHCPACETPWPGPASIDTEIFAA